MKNKSVSCTLLWSLLQILPGGSCMFDENEVASLPEVLLFLAMTSACFLLFLVLIESDRFQEETQRALLIKKMISGLSVLHSHKPQSYAAQCPRSYSFYPPLIFSFLLFLSYLTPFLPSYSPPKFSSSFSSILPSLLLPFILILKQSITIYVRLALNTVISCLLPQLHKCWDGKCVVCTCFIFSLSFYLMI